jgi:hypothetical protein
MSADGEKVLATPKDPTKLPWYDALWMQSYLRAKQHIAREHPAKLEEFLRAFDPLRVDPAFKLVHVKEFFANEMQERIKEAVRVLTATKLERHELFTFGRLMLHDHPLLNVLGEELTPRVSEWVGEEVEYCYNFFSLYNNLGVCEPHMDAPLAKWTLDYCIEQSAEWPIYFSQVVPWPEHGEIYGDNWQEQIKTDPANHFVEYQFRENEALVFAGSSQWHYRERIRQNYRQNYCNLAFFHYIPKGSLPLLEPQNWAARFGIEELNQLVTPFKGYQRTVPQS